MKVNKLKLVLFGLSIALTLGATSTAMAGGFQLFEQSAAGLGVGQANATAGCNDASTEYTNPAGMVCLKKKEVTAGVEAIFLHIKYKGTAGISYLKGPGTADAGTNNYVPNTHYVLPLSNNWYYGGGISAPFGLATEYGEDSVASLYATKSIIKTINFSQDVAYRVNDHWSAGLGLDVQYFTGELDATESTGGQGSPQVSDTNEASDTALGWHAGLLYQMTPATRFGLAYHSKIDHNATGTGTFHASDQELGNDVVTSVSTDVPIPSSFSFGVYHELGRRWALMGNLTYTLWNSIQDLTIKNIFILAKKENLTIPLDFRNTYAVGVGVTYRISNKWTGKFGVGHDQSPVVDTHRELRLPDADKNTVAIGAHYQWKANLDLDVGYEHAFVNNSNVDTTIPIGTTGQSYELKGVLNDSSADLLGMQITYKF